MSLRLAIQQPYFFPYPGYFSLISKVDVLVLLTDVQYLRRGWVNRNRLPGQDTDIGRQSWSYIRIPVTSAPRDTHIDQIKVSFHQDWKSKFRNQLLSHYGQDGFRIAEPWGVKQLITAQHSHLLPYLTTSLLAILDQLEIRTKIILSSDFASSLKGTAKIQKICRDLGCDEYWNLPGGEEIYSESDFENNNISLNFIKPMNSSLPLSQWSILHAVSSDRIDELQHTITALS